MKISVFRESWPIAGTFTIARGSKTEAEVIRVEISHEGKTGHAECVPYAQYGESLDSVCSEIENLVEQIDGPLTPTALQHLLPAGAARNAVDCALWDWQAKATGTRSYSAAGHHFLSAKETCYTLSLADADTMADQARLHNERHILKIKVGTDDDKARIHAVHTAAPDSKLIIDANEGWNESNIRDYLVFCAANNVELIEQPLPANQDAILAEIPHPVPICADESAHTSADLANLTSRYDCVNIKLDKTGGLTEALKMQTKAQAMGFSTMVGCMVGTSLAMAPALILAQHAQYVDLDGPLLLAKDREHGLNYTVNTVAPPDRLLWG